MKAKLKKVKVYRLNHFQAAIKSTGEILPIVSHEIIKYENEHGNFCADCPDYNAYVNECIPLNCQHCTKLCFNYNAATNECIPECTQCKYKGNVEQCRYDSVTAWLKRRCKI